jgi:hypothetical protein
MNFTTSLSGSHLRVYERIFQHPISHDLGWHDVLTVLRELGTVEEEPNGNVKAAINGHVQVIRPHKTKDVADTEEVMLLRRFLTEAQTLPDVAPHAADYLLVIDHREARLFRSELHGAVPEMHLPHEPDDYFRHAHHSRQFTRGQEKPDPNSFFGPIAGALRGARRIVVFGTGTGTSSEMEQFVGWLKTHHAELSKRVAGSLVVDEHHLTEGQLLAKARDFLKKTPVLVA